MSPRVTCPLLGDSGFDDSHDASLLNRYPTSLAFSALLALLVKHKGYQDQPAELGSPFVLSGGDLRVHRWIPRIASSSLAVAQPVHRVVTTDG